MSLLARPPTFGTLLRSAIPTILGIPSAPAPTAQATSSSESSKTERSSSDQILRRNATPARYQERTEAASFVSLGITTAATLKKVSASKSGWRFKSQQVMASTSTSMRYTCTPTFTHSCPPTNSLSNVSPKS